MALNDVGVGCNLIIVWSIGWHLNFLFYGFTEGRILIIPKFCFVYKLSMHVRKIKQVGSLIYKLRAFGDKFAQSFDFSVK